MTLNVTSLAKRLSITVIFSALVCVVTIIFTMYVPATRGYFNFGETMVYTAALLFGPLVGAFAGGVGSMFADLLLGYYYYAPATLIVKALEGFAVGFFSEKAKTLVESHTRREWRIFTVTIGVFVGILVGLVGFLYYSGYVELSSIISSGTAMAVIFVPAELWIIFGAFFVLLIVTIAIFSEPEFGVIILSCIFGGLLMVSGYFLYEQFLLGFFALAEVPINIGQMTIGLIVATPIVKVVRRALPHLKG